MAKKNAAKRAQTSVGFRPLRHEIGMLRKEMNEGFASLEDRLDRLVARVAGFLKLHYSLHGIEFHETKKKRV